MSGIQTQPRRSDAAMPEDPEGFLPVEEPLDEPDNPDEWRDACDDPTDDPHEDDDNG
jgi:hypothetical protein